AQQDQHQQQGADADVAWHQRLANPVVAVIDAIPQLEDLQQQQQGHAPVQQAGEGAVALSRIVHGYSLWVWRCQRNSGSGPAAMRCRWLTTTASKRGSTSSSAACSRTRRVASPASSRQSPRVRRISLRFCSWRTGNLWDQCLLRRRIRRCGSAVSIVATELFICRAPLNRNETPTGPRPAPGL